MTEEDVKRLIEFRASNEALFTGKRNSAKIAWRYVTHLYISNNCGRVTLSPTPVCLLPSTILKGLGLEGKLTSEQIAKKWDNLRTKYKVGVIQFLGEHDPTSGKSPLLKMVVFKLNPGSEAAISGTG